MQISIPVIVLAKQRSGTNLFRKSLSSSEIFEDCHEIFNLKHPGIFWKHRLQLVSQNPELSFPSEKNQKYIFDSFLEKLSTRNTNFLLLDIKYNSAHNLNLVWHDPHDAPFLFKILSDRRIPVIHLVRNNMFETYVSSIVANKLQRWIVQKGDVPENPRIKINVTHMIKELKKRRKEINSYKRWLSTFKSPKILEIAYESLVDERGDFSENVASQIRDFLGINDRVKFSIMTKKIAKHPSEIVINYENEVIPALVDNGFSNFIHKNELF